MKDNNQKLDEIYNAIVGSELNPNGLLHRVGKLEKQSSVIKKMTWTVAGILMAIGTVLKIVKL